MVQNFITKNKNPVKQSIANAPKNKKIGFFSAMMIVMGSSIGAGIFFKSNEVLEGSHGNLILAIVAWLIAGFAVISMAMALVEISSARNDNLSIIGWCKTFNNKTIYKASRNFMFYIYLPLTYFFMPLYAILSLQDAIGSFTTNGENSFGTEYDWIIWTIISLAIITYFIIVSGISSRVGNIQNKIILLVKFLPLLVAGIIGFVYIGTTQKTENIQIEGFKNLSEHFSFSALSPGLGMIIAVGGIFFAYDGFYVTAGLQTEMKAPKKTPWAILLGLGATTIIYLLIAISMSLNGDGSFFGFGDWLKEHNLGWFFGVINLLISIGILGIINGFAMWAPRFTEELIKEKELPFSAKFLNKLSDGSKPWVGVIYNLVISFPIIIIFTLIGALTYLQGNTYGENGESFYGLNMDRLYSFADLMANWTSVFAFAFIAFAIYGGIKNRKTKKVQTIKSKFFIPSAIVAVVLVGIAMFAQILFPIVDAFMILQIPNPILEEHILPRIMLIVVLVVFAIVVFLPTIIEDIIAKRKNKKNILLKNK